MSSPPHCSRFPQQFRVFALGLAAVFFAGAASAQQTAGTVQTPDVGQVAGRPVVIVAQGFLPGESVDLQVTHAGGTAEPGMGHDPWTVVAGADGKFVTTWVINPTDDQSEVFAVTARGRFSGTTSSATFNRMAAVSTDKFAYAPAEDATIAGTGFLAGEVVTLHLQRSGAAADESAGATPWTVTADEAGSIASWFVSPDGSSGTDTLVTAKGSSSGLTAAWAVTDAACLAAPTPYPLAGFVLPDVACPTNLGSCSSNDVVTTVVAANPLNGAVCGSRANTLPLNFTLKFQTNASQRYDLGTFIAEDGGSLGSGNGSPAAQVCGGAAPQVGWGDTNADPSDCDSDLFLDLDPHGNAVDTCGDIQSSAGPVYWTVTAVVSCASVDANFHLRVPSCRVWEQSANHSVACTSLSQAGTGSKCDCTDLDFTTVLDPCVTALCDDGNVCTADSCAAENGAAVCHHDPVHDGAACGDATTCTGQAQCSGGSCVSGALRDCGDNNPCTDDSCDALAGCQHVANTSRCDDGSACTTGDICGGGTCLAGAGVVCDDNNPCTDDSCDPATGCVHTDNAASCNDGNACTTNDTCGGGTCNGGPAPDCNDNNPCTDDSCDTATGCVHTNNTASCDDGSACTTNDTCGGGTCNGGPAPNCNDNNTCTDDSCDPATGCVHTNNTASCDDGSACTTNDTCGGGTCNGGPAPNCNDNNPCTDDSCDPATGCVHTNNTASCDDGSACTTNDTCGGGTCNGGPAPNCNDNNLCTDDSCDPATGCVHTNNTAPCNDGNACTTNDTCGGGTCNGGSAPNCNDSNPCTDDSCDQATGCVHTNNTNPCNDGNACTTNDTCGGGTCNGGAPLNCDDNNPCTNDSCNPAALGIPGGCVHTNNTNPCNDGNACTTGDTCGGGTCNGGPAPNCNDNNPCTNDSCDQATGCVHTNNTDPCNDGNACTTNDTCGSGTCNGGPAPNCNDNNPCTDDSCNQATGCVHTNNTNPCNDGNACTTNDTCGGGTCNGGPAPNCNDSNPCTDDSCNPVALGGPAGCVHTNNTNPCNDGNACTTNDTCGGGTCNGGPAPNCNDNNPCTNDSCDQATGCVHTNNTNACNDGNACTTNDTCGGGTCNGGPAPNCNDNNPCTNDSCDQATGCVHTNNTNPCSDGNACTTGDTCGGGTCNGGPAPNCNDSNSCTNDSCDQATGCVHTNNTNPCSDGNACTTGDTCGGGQCNAGGPTNCDDGICCTVDSCNPTTGCYHFANTAAPFFTTQPSLGNTVLWPPNHGYADFTVQSTGATASSSCGIASVQFASCSSSQPENGTGVGDGNSTRDCVYEPGALHLRAERDGACSPVGRVYETTLVAVDVCGNAAVSNPVVIGVWHDRGHQPTAGTIVRATHGSNTKDTRTGTNGTYGTTCGLGLPLTNGTVHDPSDTDPEMEISQDVSLSVNSLKLNKATGGNVLLTWTAPSHDSDVTINKYHVYRRASASSLWILIAEPTTTTYSYLDAVLNDGGPWQYKVTAVNK